MTNLKKSYWVSAFAVIALTFCVLLLSQGVIASQQRGNLGEDITPYYEGGVVPLPSGDALTKPEAQVNRTHAFTGDRDPQKAGKAIDMSARFTLPVEEGVEVGERPAPSASLAAFPGDNCANPLPVAGVGVYTIDMTPLPAGNAAWIATYSPPARAWYFEVEAAQGMGTYYASWCDDGTTGLTPAGAYTCGRYVVMTEPVCPVDGNAYNVLPYPPLNGQLCTTNPTCPAAPGMGPITMQHFMDAGDTWLVAVEVRLGESLKGSLTVTYVEPVAIDDCVLPTQIAGNGTWYQDLAGMTGDGVSPLYGGVNYEHNAWWRWHCTVTGTVTVSTCNTPMDPDNFCYADLMLGVHPDDCFAGPEAALAANDDGAACLGYQSEAEFIAVAGQYYLISVGAWDYQYPDCPPPVVQLDISTEPLIPTNDDCADATDLGIGDGVHFVHNLDATLDGPAANHCDPNAETCADVWYVWEADMDGYAVFDMCLTEDELYDSKIMIWRGITCPDAIPTVDVDPFGCSDDGCGNFGGGGLAEVTCTAGEQFLIRLAGWYNATNPCNPGGMGFGYMGIYQSATSIRPPFNYCAMQPPVALTPGVLATENGPAGIHNANWGDCAPSYVDGTLGVNAQWVTFHSFEVSTCANVRVDFCGTVDNAAGDGRYNFGAWPGGVTILTGCPCEGAFVTYPAAAGGWGNAPAGAPCDLYPDNQDLNRYWNFNGLIPGVYFFHVSSFSTGIITDAGNRYMFETPYVINFLSTQIDCEYCTGSNNPAYCPPGAEALWMSDFTFADVFKNADDGPGPAPATTPNDCNSYEDHTDMVAHVYRGLTYNMTVRMRKLTSPRHLMNLADSCTVFIDWNQNSGFAANQTELGERYSLPGTLSPVYFDRGVAVTVPLNAMGPLEGGTGVTMLRVRISDSTAGTAQACGVMPNGEVEDFVVEVADLECGDFDISGGLPDAADIAFLRAFYFGYGPAPALWQRADIDGDGVITIADLIALADAAYRGGALNCI